VRIGGAAAFLLVACNGSSYPVFGGTAPDAQSPSDATNVQMLADATGGDAAFGPDPPPMACQEDAADPCPSPPWVCTDGGAIVVAYEPGKCVSGSCVWQKVDGDCAALGGRCADPGAVDGEMIDAAADGPDAPDGSVWAAVGACVLPVPAGPDPPAMLCDVDGAAEGGVCPPPPSVCAGMDTIDAPGWLIDYDDGQCLAGQCVWQKKRTMCSGVFLCTGGACVYQGSDPALN
jgi:hypothetical protein